MLKKITGLIFVLAMALLVRTNTAHAALTVGANSVTSDGVLTLQGTSVNVNGGLIMPIGATATLAHISTYSLLSGLLRNVRLGFNMTPTTTLNSYNLDDTTVSGSSFGIGLGGSDPRFFFDWAPAGSNPVTPRTLVSITGSNTPSAISDGALYVGQAVSGSATGGVTVFGGSGIGYSMNTPGNIGYIYPLSASTIGIGFSGGFGVRPTTPLMSIAASGITIGTHLTLGPATSHIISSQTTPPTPSVTGSGYSGASMDAGSTDTKGTITATVGAAAGTLVVTFNSAYASAPVCSATPATATAQVDITKMYATTATGALTLNFVATPTGGSETWSYICVQ